MRQYALNERLRARLKRPLGKLLPNGTSKDKIRKTLTRASLKVAIGDSTTDLLLELGIVPDVHVVDGRERRMARPLPKMMYTRQIYTLNPPGSISEEALKSIADALQAKGPVRVLVDGEEDLLTLPAIVFSPDGAIILYGQPLEGLVIVNVDKNVRTKVLSILEEMGIPRPLLRSGLGGSKG